MTISQYILIAIVLVIAGLRIAGITHESYQAAAHLFVGGLVGAWLIERKGTTIGSAINARIDLLLAIALSVVEVACFLWFRFVQ